MKSGSEVTRKAVKFKELNIIRFFLVFTLQHSFFKVLHPTGNPNVAPQLEGKQLSVPFRPRSYYLQMNKIVPLSHIFCLSSRNLPKLAGRERDKGNDSNKEVWGLRRTEEGS